MSWYYPQMRGSHKYMCLVPSLTQPDFQSVSKRTYVRLYLKNQTPETIPEPKEFPGIKGLFPKEPEILLCPDRILAAFVDLAQKQVGPEQSSHLLLHWTTGIMLLSSHIARWLVIQITNGAIKLGSWKVLQDIKLAFCNGTYYQ